eukprot:scaffold970_cov412-Prasinococcus_capsulatus_cf.AAC.5
MSACATFSGLRYEWNLRVDTYAVVAAQPLAHPVVLATAGAAAEPAALPGHAYPAAGMMKPCPCPSRLSVLNFTEIT